MKKLFSIFITVFLLVSVFTVSTSALNLTVHDNTVSSGSQVTNLINYASSYPNFYEKDYVCFTDSQFSYYVVWGDFTVNNNKVTGDNVQYCRYYRTNESGYNGTYDYYYGEDDNFTLNLNDKVITSNISKLGFNSNAYQEYKFYNDTVGLSVLLVSIGFAVMLTLFRRS